MLRTGFLACSLTRFTSLRAGLRRKEGISMDFLPRPWRAVLPPSPRAAGRQSRGRLCQKGMATQDFTQAPDRRVAARVILCWLARHSNGVDPSLGCGLTKARPRSSGWRLLGESITRERCLNGSKNKKKTSPKIGNFGAENSCFRALFVL